VLGRGRGGDERTERELSGEMVGLEGRKGGWGAGGRGKGCRGGWRGGGGREGR